MDYQEVIFYGFISIMIVAILGCIFEWIAFKKLDQFNDDCCAQETIDPTDRYIDQ